MLTVSHIKKSFGTNLVLRDVSFQLADGEFVGVIGPSGGGKSVLLKILASVLVADQGTVEHQGTLSGQGVDPRRVGFSFQEGALFDSMSVIENTAFPLLHLSGKQAVSYDSAMKRSYDILCEVGLGKAAHKLPGQLSGGMQRRAALARALVSEPELVLLDDPTGGLDPVAASVIMNLIAKLHNHYNPTVVLVSHDLRRLLPNVSRIIGLFDGIVQFDGPPEQLATEANSKIKEFVATRFELKTFKPSSNDTEECGP